MKTQGEIEEAICEGISRFEQDYRGRSPKDIRAYLIDDLLVVRLGGLLTPAEQQLAKIPSEKGRDLLKQVRTHLIETAKPHLQAMAQEITGVKMVMLAISRSKPKKRISLSIGPLHLTTVSFAARWPFFFSPSSRYSARKEPSSTTGFTSGADSGSADVRCSISPVHVPCGSATRPASDCIAEVRRLAFS